MKKLLALILVAVIILCPVLTSCSGTAKKYDKLTFYCVGEYGDELCEFIKKYNKYCAVNDTFEDSVEFVYFDSTTEMNAVLSTELMAGGGLTFYQLPKLFLLKSWSETVLLPMLTKS